MLASEIRWVGFGFPMIKGAILLRVTATGYEPAEEDGVLQHGKLSPGDMLYGKIWRSRSLPQHRLFWGLLRLVAEATEYETPENLLLHLKIWLGKCQPVKLRRPAGKITLSPDSIAFEEMPQDEFQEFFDNSVRIICETVIPGSNREELLAQAQRMLGPPPAEPEDYPARWVSAAQPGDTNPWRTTPPGNPADAPLLYPERTRGRRK